MHDNGSAKARAKEGDQPEAEGCRPPTTTVTPPPTTPPTTTTTVAALPPQTPTQAPTQAYKHRQRRKKLNSNAVEPY
jgi:hypothetical protein